MFDQILTSFVTKNRVVNNSLGATRRHLLVRLVCLGASLLGWVSGELRAQLDTEFWFVAPEVWANHGDEPIMFRFSTSDAPATVTLEMPANPAFAPLVVNIGANAAVSLNMTPYMEDVENRPANLVLQKGIHITSTSDISCYYEIDNDLNADLFVLKGSNALGTEFLLPFQTQLTNHFPEAPASFDIVATEDNTVVTIVPTEDLIGHPAGVAFDVVLNAGQTYGCRAAGLTGPAHPAGTSVTSSAPIAITIADDSAEQFANNQLCFDLIGDQITPITEAGVEFIAQRGALATNERIFILATTDGTGITQNGTPLLGNLNSGETLSLQLTTPTLHIATTEPVLIFQVTGFGCEVGGGLLPALECTGSGEVVFVRSTTDNFRMNVLTPAGTEGDFTINGNPNLLQAADFAVVPATGGDWLFAQLVNPGFVGTGAATQVINPSGAFHLGLMMGTGGSYARFGYFSDFAKPTFDLAISDDDVCAGESVQIQPAPIPNATYNWTFNDAPYSVTDTLTFAPVSTADAGMYILSGVTADGCEIEPDTFILEVAAGPPALTPTVDAPICEGAAVVLSSGAPATADSVVWMAPNGNATVSQDLDWPSADPAFNGDWSVSAYTDGCGSSPAVLSINVVPTATIDLGTDEITACAGDAVDLPLGNVASGGLFWHIEGNNLGIGPGDAWQDLGLNEAGWWVLQGDADGCEVVPDSLWMVVVQPQDLVLGVPEFLCTLGDPFELSTSYIGPGNWDASCTFCINPSTGLFDPAAAGEGPVEVTYNGTGVCPASMTVSFDILLTPDPGIVLPEPACVGTPSVDLVAALGGGQWSAPGCAGCIDGDAFLPAVAGEGTWYIDYDTFGDCPATANATFEVTANPSSGFSPASDFCINALPVALLPVTGGGEFSGPGVSASGSFNPIVAGEFEVSHTLPGVCGSTTTETLTVHPLPDPGFDATPLSGCVPFVVEGTATAAGEGNSLWSFTHAHGGVSTEDTPDNVVFTMYQAGCGELSRTVTSAAGCTASSDAVIVCGAPSPSSGFQVSPPDPSRFAPWIVATSVYDAADSALVDWDWHFQGDDGMGQDAPSANINLLLAPVEPATVCLTVTDSTGCSATTCRSIPFVEPVDFFAPSAFTPDNDGLNDAWIVRPFGFTASEVLDYRCVVLDRWGHIVFESTVPGEPWVGDISGGAHFAEDGVYAYSLQLRLLDGRRMEKTGAVVLTR